MSRQSGLAVMAAGVTIALLAISLLLNPGAAVLARSTLQGTPGASDGPLMPLYFFLAKPNPQFALVLNSLRLTETQSTGLAMAMADEARLLSDAQTRKTLNEDVGPIAQATWQKLRQEVLTNAQYDTLSRWAASQRDFAVGVLRDAVSGSAPLATTGSTTATTGTPTVPPAIQNLLATAQAVTGTPISLAQASTPVGTPPVGTQPAATRTATSVPATTTPVPPTATATQVLSMATVPANTATTATPARATGAAVGSLTVVGEGRAVATPNVARLTVGVEVISDTVRLATGDANQRTQAIITRLKGLGIAEKDIQTSGYSIFPYREPEQRPVGPATQGGPTPTRPRNQYRVSSTIRVTVRDLNNVGPVIDGAVEAGANTVNGIQFTVEDPTPIQDQARANAFADARRRALQLAQLAGATLGPPSYITEIIGSPPPAARAVAAPALAAPAFAGPPIEGGELTYSTQLQITFELR